MNKKSIVLAIFIIFTFSSACIFADWFDSFRKNPAAWIFGEDYVNALRRDSATSEEDLEGIEEDTEPLEGIDDEVVEPDFYSLADIFNNKAYESADTTLDIIIPDFTQLARAKVVFKEEEIGDNIYTFSGITPGGNDLSADIIGTGYFQLELPTDGSAPPMDARIPCSMKGTANEPFAQVLCAGEESTENIYSWQILLMTMMEPIPQADDTRHRVLSVVLDSDRQPENDFVPLDEGDFYQYTDLWYEIIYSPENGWSWLVSRSDGTQVESQAKALIYRNTVAFVIPSIEIPADDPAVRWVTWSHHGMFLADNFYGNVSSSLATESPTPVEPNLLHIYEEYQGAINMLGKYELCQWGGCKEIFDPRAGKNVNQDTRCECDGCTNNPSCECTLFIRDLVHDPRSLAGSRVIVWEYAAGQGEDFTSSEWVLRKCFCVEKKE